MNGSKQDTYLKEWQSQEATAERMLPVIGTLYRDKNVVTTVYGRSLVHSTAIDILKAHRFARHTVDNELAVADSWPLLEAI
jgi:glyceraldehyde 3-phosphate dehydrogenase